MGKDQHRVRFCLKEFKQERGKLTYSPVVSDDEMFIVLAYGHQLGWGAWIFDVSSAFLHGKHPYKNTVRMPVSLREFDADGDELVYPVDGNCYGSATA